MARRLVVVLCMLVLPLALGATPAHAAKRHRAKKLLVCHHGCPYRTIQSAVNAARAGQTVRVKPGKYSEGVIVKGHAKNGLHIVGTGTDPTKTILDGKNAKGRGGAAQNGIEGEGVDNLHIENMWARNYAANGFFVHDCNGYEMKKLVASFNRAYGLFAFNCVGGRMTRSSGYGQADSAFYVGQTPVQSKPVWTYLDHLEGYENALGYSGTNSKYVDIRDSEFYNNGIGVVPNTLDSEKFEPTSNGIIEENLIYWNNFDVYKPDSPVKVSGNTVGSQHYPIGIGVYILGGTGWKIRNNSIFGNFKWGAVASSDPGNKGDNAISNANEFTYNTMGAAFGDANGTDYWFDGSGHGNCVSISSAGSTFDPGVLSGALLYPSCPAPNSGTGGSLGDLAQDGELLDYTSKTTAEEDSWKKHPHPARLDRKPIDGM
jgi:hypothetical protein